MHPTDQKARSQKRPSLDRKSIPTLGKQRRATVAEQQPAVRAVLEHLLIREGYELCHPEEAREQPSEPILLLVGIEDGDGLYVLKTHDITGTLAEAPFREDLLRHFLSKADGIHAFLPKPFGAADVLSVVRAVGAFDSRKRSPRNHASM